MGLIIKIALGIILALVLLVAGCGVLVASSTDSDGSSSSPTDLEAMVEEVEEDLAAGSPSQENAVRSAESYLSHQSFSRSGLIKQLEYEGYSTADATYAVDTVVVDWNEQAARSAKSYLENQPFSRAGLIDQLEYEGFSAAQAIYGVNQTGL